MPSSKADPIITVPIDKDLADRYHAATVEYTLRNLLLRQYLTPETNAETRDELISKAADAKGIMDDALLELHELAYAHGATSANGETISIYPDKYILKIINAGGVK